MEAIEALGGKPFFDYQVPNAVITLKQGFGRLIRSLNDRGVLMLLDPRIQRQRYGRIFLESLPALPPHTRDHRRRTVLRRAGTRPKIKPFHGPQPLHPRRQPYRLRSHLLRHRLYQHRPAARLARRRLSLAYHGPGTSSRRPVRRARWHSVIFIRASRTPSRRRTPGPNANAENPRKTVQSKYGIS